MSDDTGGVATSISLPERTAEWLDAYVADRGMSRDEFLDRLITAYRTAEADGEVMVSPSRVADVESRVEAVETDFDEKIQDVRRRVVQVKRETDAKAATDHDHEAVEERLAAVTQETEALASGLAALDESLQTVDATVEEGFENFESILEYLTETTDDLDAQSSMLARVLLDVRAATERLSNAHCRRAATERLTRAAQVHGVRTADCSDCGASLDVAMLTEPRCPHCEATFGDVRPRQGLFGSATLETGDQPPALESGVDTGSDALGTDSRSRIEALAEEADDDR